VGDHRFIIDGVAIGPLSLAGRGGTLRINGINIEVLPVAIFTFPGSMVTTFLNVAFDSFYAGVPEPARTVIYGLSLSGGMFEEVEMHGVSVNINSYSSYSHGLEMSLLMNSNYLFTGAQLSLWGNRAADGRGLQFGFFNSCQECNVVQIGFLNRIGNRVLPLINFNFKKKHGRARKKRRPL
jgi:hypothetical protein